MAPTQRSFYRQLVATLEGLDQDSFSIEGQLTLQQALKSDRYLTIVGCSPNMYSLLELRSEFIGP